MNNMASRPAGSSGDEPESLPAGIPDWLPGRLLGIDAGGSATRVVVISEGKIVRRLIAPPMNALLTGDLAERLLGLIAAEGVTAAGIGMPGLRSPTAAARLSAELAELAGCPVRVATDGQIAVLGAFGTAPGIAVFAGTGSGAMGFDGERWARAGGHGFLLGDEGSAYWIGRSAASAALRWEDGMGGSEVLRDAVVQATGTELAGLVHGVHSHPADRGRLARLAPVVTELAAVDETARQIAGQAATHLAELALAVRRALGPLPVCGLGGVFRAPVIWDRFAGLTDAVRPLASPEVGAALLAWRDHA